MFRDESPIQQYKHLENVDYINKILDSIMAGAGIIYLVENQGMIIGIFQPTIWDDTTLALYELAWYVKPEYRHTSAGYRLLSTYLKKAEQLKESGRIGLYTLTKMTTSPNMKYEKFGLIKTDENWINHA